MKTVISAALAMLWLCASAGANATIAPLSDWQCQMMQRHSVLPSDAPIGCQRLAKVEFEFIHFNGDIKVGNVIVLDVVAAAVAAIFADLKQQGFPLHSARLMREFSGDDNASMNANNSSAFNARAISGGRSWSKHAYGVAIDINPLQNPFLSFDDAGNISVAPAQSAANYVNRNRYRARAEVTRQGMAEAAVEVFAHHGFLIWGGDWNQPIDTQHFEVGSRALVQQLVELPPAQASALFQRYRDDYRHCRSLNTNMPNEQARAHCAYQTVQAY
ncbi:M15 family metallopeptidase [Ferrimonas senticii]|uniref:M15 family metallopeptidase n=1 Tax=Ferrimonas senticii TaxID=394566 RepID=UPI0004866AF8|nr:M15 family metallopeptidase [Ferrimonas senticii]